MLEAERKSKRKVGAMLLVAILAIVVLLTAIIFLELNPTGSNTADLLPSGTVSYYLPYSINQNDNGTSRIFLVSATLSYDSYPFEPVALSNQPTNNP